MKLYKVVFFTLITFLLANPILAQQDTSCASSPCKVRFKYEVPAALIGIGLTQYLYSILPNKAVLTPAQALALDKNNVNGFDRPVFDFPASGYTRAHNNSNYLMYSTFALPGILMLDKNIRRDWKEVSSMYVQVHAFSSAIYLATTFPIRRARPLAYNEDYPIELRSGQSTNNAFFSGHTNSTAAVTFFMANIYSHYYDFSIGQKALLYLGASIPPAFVARYRMRAGKHFRTDVMTGFAMGAAVGILVPELHRVRDNKSLSYAPYYSNGSIGLVMNYKF